MHLVARAIIGAALLLSGTALTIYGAVNASYAPAFRWGVVGWFLSAIALAVIVSVFQATRREARREAAHRTAF